MDGSPMRLPSGKIGCPKCSTALQKEDAPFHLNGRYVGDFASYVCPACRYSALTEDGYESARVRAKQMCLIEDKQDIEVH